MVKKVIIYGVLMAGLIFLLKLVEYRFLIRDLSLELYIGLIAVFFTVLGTWTGLRLTMRKKIEPVPAGSPFVVDQAVLTNLGISKREHEVLELMAEGLSNQEIADRLFLSLNTVKSHTSNLFVKLDVKRRTQAVQRAKELKLIR